MITETLAVCIASNTAPTATETDSTPALYSKNNPKQEGKQAIDR